MAFINTESLQKCINYSLDLIAIKSVTSFIKKNKNENTNPISRMLSLQDAAVLLIYLLI